MIKKLAALALALLMSLSLAACGSQKDDQAGGAVTPGVTGDAVPDMGTVSGSTVTPQDVAELSVEQVPAALESYGFTDVTAQLTTVDFAGQKNVPAVAVSAMNGDIATYELLVCLKAGNYSFSVTLCSFTEDVTADMAALFTAAQ